MNFYTNVTMYRNTILHRGIKDGKPFKKVEKINPLLFINTDQPSEYKTIHGKYVKPIQFKTRMDATKYIKDYDRISGVELYGQTDYAYSFIYNNYPKEIEFDSTKISVGYFDIEVNDTNGFPNVDAADEPITAITLSKNGKKIVLSYKDFNQTGVDYFKCSSEEELLLKFIELWSKQNLDVITGWNIEFFDIPYIINRIVKIHGMEIAEKLSPWNILTDYKTTIRGNESRSYRIEGITTLDYLNLYKKFTYKIPESYRLDYIASIEVGSKKLDYSEYSNLGELYNEDFNKFITYNMRDVELVELIDDKLKLLDLVFTMAYDAKTNYIDCLGTVRQWDVIIHNYLMDKKIVIPINPKTNRTTEFSGGYVKEPKIGMSKWVVSFDLNSLYPSLIQQYNIGPDTFVGKRSMPTIEQLLERKEFVDQRVDYCYAANGCLYKKDKQSFLSALMETMYADRVKFKKTTNEKKQMLQSLETEYKEKAKDSNYKTKKNSIEKEISKYNNLQQSKKIQLNSAYGALGNPWFRWFDVRHAEAITLSGQLSIRWVERDINTYLNNLLKTNEDYIIASDTDSVYITFEKLIDLYFKDKSDEKKIVKFLDKICEEKLVPVINNSYQNLFKYLNAKVNKMEMKREAIANKGIWTAKKRYILNVWDLEGVLYDQPKLKMMGIEAIRSSTPSVARKYITESLSLIMNKTEIDLQKFVSEVKDAYKTLPLEEIAFPRGTNDIEKWIGGPMGYSSGTPIHVRGCIVFNNMLKDRDLIDKYETISSGDKIKFVYLRMPNPCKSNIVSFNNILPEEFGLNNYIDYNLQFEKSFLEPIKNITKTIKWNVSEVSNLERLFQ